MKVKDLVEALSKFDGNLDVLCYTEDEALLAQGHIFRLLDIDNVSEVMGEKCRGDDHLATLKFGKSALAERHVLLNVVGDF